VKVFLDVGAHLGETLEAALDPRYAFDRIYCFEPAQTCRAQLEAYERLIYDAMSGDHTLFSTAESIEKSLGEVDTAPGGPAAGQALPARILGAECDPPVDCAQRVATAIRTRLARVVTATTRGVSRQRADLADYCAPPVSRPFSAEVGADLGPLRVAS
jgi:hypothetical protein